MNKTELLCRCYGVWLFLFIFSVYSISNIRLWVKLNYCVHVTMFDFSFLILCLLYHQHQEVSKTELLCACYGVWLFLFSFSVYSIINISGWVKLNYCMHVTVFDYFFSPSLSTLSSIINIRRWIILCMLRCLIISFFLLSLLYHQHQMVSKTELLCACYGVWLFLSPSLSTLSSTSDCE